MGTFEDALRREREAATQSARAAEEASRRVDEIVGEAVRFLVKAGATSVPAYAGTSGPRLLGRGRQVARAWPIGAIDPARRLVHDGLDARSRNVGATAVFRGSGYDVLGHVEHGHLVPWTEHLSGLVAAYALANGRA